MWDGKPARIVRKDHSISITGARVSVFGGIQPAVFRRVFGSEDGSLYLADGTIFRFLLISEGVQFHELTSEAWDDDSRQTWEMVLRRSLRWADVQVKNESTTSMILDVEAQARFLDWRNDREGIMGDLPPALRGFLPKSYSYALRLAGVIHCLHRFADGKDPCKVLTITDIDRGIKVADFHLGQTTDAFQMIEDEDHAPEVADERVDILAQVLESLRGQVDSGRLAVGFVCDAFNSKLPKEQQFKNAKAFGSFVRSLGIKISDGLHDANGKARVRCILWDEKLLSFIGKRLERLVSLESFMQQRSTERDVALPMSRTSRSLSNTEQFCETCETLENQCLGSQTAMSNELRDMRDVRDDFLKEEFILI